jgi:hypothetical protein
MTRRRSGLNTVFVFDGRLRIAHLGDLGVLTDEQLRRSVSR